MAAGTAFDYAALQKERLAKQAGVKKWEDIFLQPYETAAQQVQTQAAYDISGAFAQYKQSELSAMRNTQLGSGFKEQIASDLASQYGSAFSQIKQQEASNISQLQTSYLKTLAEQEEALLEEGQQFAAIESALYDYMGVDTRALELAYGAEEDGIIGLGWFEGGKITERGIDALDKALNDYYNATEEDKGQLFAEYLAEQNPELYDWYKQNSGAVRELVAGISAEDRDYSKEERAYEIAFNDLYTEENENLLNTVKTHFTYKTKQEQLEMAKVTLSFEGLKDEILENENKITQKLIDKYGKGMELSLADMRLETTKGKAAYYHNQISHLKNISDFENTGEYLKYIEDIEDAYKWLKNNIMTSPRANTPTGTRHGLIV